MRNVQTIVCPDHYHIRLFTVPDTIYSLVLPEWGSSSICCYTSLHIIPKISNGQHFYRPMNLSSITRKGGKNSAVKPAANQTPSSASPAIFAMGPI